MTAIAVRGVSVAFDGHEVVDRVTLNVPSGSWLGLIGPNGAGKSTLLRAIAGLVDYSGEILLGDREVGTMGRRRIARAIAFVPQTPFIPRWMSVTDYVLMGRTPYIPYLGVESAHDLSVVGEVLRELELSELTHRPLASLSGGELQRVVLGRALAQRASVLLLDEPTSALDVGHQQQVLELVDALRRANDLTVISAMHDLTLVGQFADTLVLLDAGRAAATGSAEVVLTESSIREHYGAHARVLRDPSGAILVVPTRPPRTTPAHAAAERPAGMAEGG